MNFGVIVPLVLELLQQAPQAWQTIEQIWNEIHGQPGAQQHHAAVAAAIHEARQKAAAP